jgi:phosphatidylglycerophosphatase A
VRLLEHDEQIRRAALGTVPGFFAFGFGSGLSRFAPGTMGTLVAIPFAPLLKSLAPIGYWGVLIILFLLGIWICGVTAGRLGRHDPGGIVWDEMVGYWLTVAFIPMHWAWLAAAFVLFRVFDILKPWPIRSVERLFKGGLGIMADDILAAIYAMLVMAGVGRFLG